MTEEKQNKVSEFKDIGSNSFLIQEQDMISMITLLAIAFIDFKFYYGENKVYLMMP